MQSWSRTESHQLRRLAQFDPHRLGFFYLGIHFIPGYLIPAMLTFAKFADVRFACIRALALFPINNEHQTEQHHTTWPNAADNPTPEEFAIGDELEQSYGDPDDHEP